MKFMIKYARQKLNSILLILLFLAVFLVVGLLYQLPMAAILYSVYICLFFGIIAFVLGFIKEKEKLETLRRIEQEINMLEFALPKSTSEVELTYQSLIEGLKKERLDGEMKTQEKYRQMMDYFTLWVHQIKTPIASMRLTLGQMDSEQARRLMSDLTRIEQYVSMVLTYLRLDFDSTDYVLREHDLDEIIRPIVRKFAPDFIAKKLNLNYEAIGRKMITDEKWLSFTLEQILSNAIKYTQRGSVSIYCQEDKLVIEDTGIGISSQDLPRIFEKGFTGFNGRVNKKASGIGLYLCKRICDDLGMEIFAQSRVDHGTKIFLTITQPKIDVRD